MTQERYSVTDLPGRGNGCMNVLADSPAKAVIDTWKHEPGRVVYAERMTDGNITRWESDGEYWIYRGEAITGVEQRKDRKMETLQKGKRYKYLTRDSHPVEITGDETTLNDIFGRPMRAWLARSLADGEGTSEGREGYITIGPGADLSKLFQEAK